MSVAIVTPVYRNELQPDEQISIRHLRSYLGRYDWYQISPVSLKFRLERCKEKKFHDDDFSSVDSYSRLMLARRFYEAFADYEYILIYQLDCLVFRDELEWWCRQGFDYIGAPLFKMKDDPASGFSGACNGGLSLRKVSSFLKVLNSRRYVAEQVSFLKDVFHQPFVEVRPLTWSGHWKKRIAVAREVRQGVDAYAGGYTLNEDHFWSGRAAYFCPEFRLAGPLTALAFAFEVAPAHCHELNKHELPFGAHAWNRYDRSFWSPFLIKN